MTVTNYIIAACVLANKYLWAKIIFGGKLRNPYFCHIFGMENQIFFLKKGMY